MKLAALSLVGAIVSMAGGAVFAQAIHPVCVANQHDCGKAAKISTSCCGGQGASREEATPAQSRIEVSAGLSATPALGTLVHVAPAPQPVVAVNASPPRLCSLDLPILFSTFLI